MELRVEEMVTEKFSLIIMHNHAITSGRRDALGAAGDQPSDAGGGGRGPRAEGAEPDGDGHRIGGRGHGHDGCGHDGGDDAVRWPGGHLVCVRAPGKHGCLLVLLEAGPSGVEGG